jgi:DNA polymerase-3 subunit delta'
MVGNLALRQRLFGELKDHSLSHAYILEGASGMGKHTLALRIAMALACQRKEEDLPSLPCMGCPSCKKILNGNSPDVIYIHREEDKATLGVEVIRNLKNDVYVAPNDLDVKVYIIEEAHLMTEAAQNAFLLTLEEPPAYVLFLLLCENAGVLLETIRSRAPVLRLQPVTPSEMQEYLRRNHREAASLAETNPTELDELILSANGSLGRAVALLNSAIRKPILAQRQCAREFIRLCAGRRNGMATIRFLKTLSAKRDELIQQLNGILLCLRDLLLCKQTENAPLCFFADREEAFSLSYRFTTPDLLSLYESIDRACDRLRANSNVRLTLTALAVESGMLTV